jgi:hypothetical protein
MKSAGIELVSPPMALDEALEAMNKFWAWANSINVITNSTCGFHMGVSIADIPIYKIDIIKLALFLGDSYVLKVFDRLTNDYTKSALAAITKNINGHEVGIYIREFKKGIGKIAYNSIIQSIAAVVNEKYMTINLHDKYIEFRCAGGNYIENKANIENTLIRYTKAMAIAADPDAEKEEYAKKLFKLLDSKQAPKNKDTVHLFAKYVAGEITLSQLKANMYNIHSDRIGPNRLKSVKDAEEEEIRFRNQLASERRQQENRQEERLNRERLYNKSRNYYNPSDR